MEKIRVIDFSKERTKEWCQAVEKMRVGFGEATEKREKGRAEAARDRGRIKYNPETGEYRLAI